MRRTLLFEIIRGLRRRSCEGVVVDNRTDVEIAKTVRESLVDALIHTCEAFIAWGRRRRLIYGDFSELEFDYMASRLPLDFDERSDEAQARWLEENRESNDNGLILYVINNYERMEIKRYKLQMFYILSALTISA